MLIILYKYYCFLNEIIGFIQWDIRVVVVSGLVFFLSLVSLPFLSMTFSIVC